MGEAFLDGSSSYPTRLQYSTSACCVVGMETVSDRPRLQLRMDVALDDGRDGPEAAEISAVEYLLHHCILPLVAWSDCQNVVDAFERGELFCTSPEHPYCVYWRRVFKIYNDHGCPGGLSVQKIKAHCTASNYGSYNMSYMAWLGNRYADKGACSTARLMAAELNLAGYVEECEKIEKDHAGLCKWIARVTNMVNDAGLRDAIPNPEGYTGAARKRIPMVAFQTSKSKRRRIITTPAARATGVATAMDIQEIVTTGTYANLPSFNLEAELEAAMEASNPDEATMEVDDSSEFNLEAELEAVMEAGSLDAFNLEAELEAVMEACTSDDMDLDGDPCFDLEADLGAPMDDSATAEDPPPHPLRTSAHSRRRSLAMWNLIGMTVLLTPPPPPLSSVLLARRPLPMRPYWGMNLLTQTWWMHI